MTRAEMADMVDALHAEGATWRDTTEMLGISASYYYDLLNDPTGTQTKARKDSYRQPCPRCGRLMTGSNGRNGKKTPKICIDCLHREQRQDAVWTRESAVEAVRWFYSTVNRPIKLSDFHPKPAPGLFHWQTMRTLGFKVPDLCESAGVPFHSGFRGFGARNGGKEHGTYYRYQKGKCRCDECMTFMRARWAERKRRAKVTA